MRASRDLLQVGSADAAGMNADENFARANLRDGDFFQADIVHAVVDGSLHRGW